MKLPPEYRQEYDRREPAGDPRHVCRALTDAEGNLGEGFVLTDGPCLFIFSRRLTEDIRSLKLPWAEVEGLDLADDRPFCKLRIGAQGGELELKFAGSDRPVLESLRACADNPEPPRAAATPPTATPTPPATARPPADSGPPPAADPAVIFCAAMVSMMNADGKIEAEEWHALTRLMDDASVRGGLAWYRAHGLDAVIAEARNQLGADQRLCLLANLTEVAMADGALHRAESALVQRYRQELRIGEDDYETIYQILLLKNNVSIIA